MDNNELQSEQATAGGDSAETEQQTMLPAVEAEDGCGTRGGRTTCEAKLCAENGDATDADATASEETDGTEPTEQSTWDFQSSDVTEQAPGEGSYGVHSSA